MVCFWLCFASYTALQKNIVSNLNIVDMENMGGKRDTALGKLYHAITNQYLLCQRKELKDKMVHALYILQLMKGYI